MNNIEYLRTLVENVLNEYYEGNDFIVYHCARKETLPSLFKFGFEGYFAARGVGNMYGRGVYSTFSLRSSINNAKRGEYGNVILKCKVRSIKNFLIFIKDLAIREYGENWKLEDQLKLLVPSRYISMMERQGVLKQIINVNPNHSSVNAYAFTCAEDAVPEIGKNVEGYIFVGNHDGDVAVIKDFKNVLPIQYSTDMGKTWKDIPKTKAYERNVENDVDLKYHVGNLYDEVPYNFTNGFAKVKKRGKYNYLNQETYKEGVISDVWFDSGSDTFTTDGYCLVYKDGTPYYIYYDKDDKTYSILDNDKDFICYLSDFQDYLDNGFDDFSTW